MESSSGLGTRRLPSTGNPFPLNFEVAKELLRDPDAFATTLHIILASAYGVELYEEDGPFSDTLNLWPTIHQDFGVWTDEANENRINAMLLTMTGEEVFDSAAAFISVCSALTNGDPGGAVDGIFDDLEFPVLVWGIYEISLNRNMSEQDGPVLLEHFAPGVQELIVAASSNENSELPEFANGAHADYFVFEQKQVLIEQLTRLGVSPGVLRFIQESEETPLHDNEGNVVTDGYEETDLESYA